MDCSPLHPVCRWGITKKPQFSCSPPLKKNEFAASSDELGLAAAVSILGLRLELPVQCLAANAVLCCPSPSSSFRRGWFLGSRARNSVVITLLLWWECQDAPASLHLCHLCFLLCLLWIIRLPC